VVVLPNGIDNATWEVEPVEDDPSVVTVVSVMRLAPRKRPLALLKMVRRVVARLGGGAGLRVVIIGEGPERPQLERFLRDNDLTEVVELVGRRSREEIRDIFARSDVFVAPANLESFGIAALEARCAGLPVVAKSRTGIREFVEHGREGLLASTDSDMVDQLTRIVQDRELRLVMAKNNRETPSPVDWSAVVRRTEVAYREAIALRAAPPGP
jgi:glycosyltransferase involved in cell wall biosynthesis